MVRNQQRPYANAARRRRRVRGILAKAFKGRCSTQLARNSGSYWKQATDTACAVFVPGARNNMLDKGHLQYMGLGVCTVSPGISTMFPRFVPMVNGEHYVQCSGDYSDLVEKVQWCLDNPKECLRIGKNARGLFDQNCLPKKAVEWVEEVMENHYK